MTTEDSGAVGKNVEGALDMTGDDEMTGIGTARAIDMGRHDVNARLAKGESSGTKPPLRRGITHSVSHSCYYDPNNEVYATASAAAAAVAVNQTAKSKEELEAAGFYDNIPYDMGPGTVGPFGPFGPFRSF